MKDLLPKGSREVTAPIALAAALLTAVAIVSVWTSRRAADAADRVTQTMEVRFALAQLLAAIDDAEVGQRGFLANGLPAQKQTWEKGAARAREAAGRLLELTVDHATQQERARLVAARVEDLLGALGSEAQAAPARPTAAPEPAAGAAPAATPPAAPPSPTATSPAAPTVTAPPRAPRLTEGLLDELRGRVATLDSEEERLLRVRAARGVSSSRLAAALSLGGLIAAGALALGAMRRAGRDRAARQAATDALLRQRALLESVLLEMGDGCLVMDAHRRLLVVNQAARRIFGLEIEGELPDDWPERMRAFLPDKKTPFPADQGPLLLATKGIASDRVMIWLAQGRGRWASITARPVRGPEGEVIAGVAVVRESNGPGAASSPGIPTAR